MPISYACVDVDKREWPTEVELTFRISSQLGEIIDRNKDYFDSFDHVLIYYDNRQTTLTKIILSVFSSHFSDVQFRKVQPVDNLLFQIADLICTMELMADKADRDFIRKRQINGVLSWQ